MKQVKSKEKIFHEIYLSEHSKKKIMIALRFTNEELNDPLSIEDQNFSFLQDLLKYSMVRCTIPVGAMQKLVDKYGNMGA